MSEKIILRFETGERIPADAVYLTTITDEQSGPERIGDKIFFQPKQIWHYFLIKIKD